MPSVEFMHCCRLCGCKLALDIEVALCCHLTPKPQGWCASCGEPTTEGKTFGGRPWSTEFQAEAYSSQLRTAVAR